jgi:Zn-finger nucleic acid-binding protein
VKAASAPRVLNQCGACGRQYDVTHLESGRRVRCACGRTFDTLRRDSHVPRALRCSNCGGNLADGARACGYCAAVVTLEELRLSSVCPACFARMASDAHFCMECGIEIAPQALFAIATGVRCPRCKGELRSREVGGTSITECAQCAGMWLDSAAFERLCERKEVESVAPGTFGPPPMLVSDSTRAGAPSQGYIPCLSCAQLMTRKNFASTSGVIMDVCRAHGVWLDAQELERILAFIRGGGLDRARAKQIETLRRAEAARRERQAAQSGVGSFARDATLEIGGEIGFGALLGLLEAGLS